MHVLSANTSESPPYFHALMISALSDPTQRLHDTYPTRDEAIQAVQQIFCRSPLTAFAVWAVIPTQRPDSWAVMEWSVIPADAHYCHGLLSHTVWAETLRNVCPSDTIILCRTRYLLFSWTMHSPRPDDDSWRGSEGS